jgi:predicted transposase YdaD
VKPKGKAQDDSQIFDRIFRENAEQIFLPLVNRELGLGIQKYEPLTEKITRTLQREMDFLYRATNVAGEEFVLHIEFQARAEKAMVYRMAEYHGLILKKYQLPVRHIVVYLGKGMRTSMPDRLPPKMVFSGFDLINLHALDTEQLLTSQVPEVVLLAILGSYPEERTEAVLRSIVRQLQKVCKDPSDFSRSFGQLTFLSRLRNLEEKLIQIIEDMPITYDITKDGFYIRGSKEGEARGEARGKALGEARGEARGEEKTLKHVVGVCQERGFSMEETAHFLKLQIETVEKYWRKD